MLWFNAVLLIFATLTSTVDAANPKKPHGHNGTLAHYDGKPLPFKVTGEQNKKLEQGQPVAWNEKGVGKSGKGVVLQDIHASPAICMSKIRDLPMYPKMVPHCKKVNIYETTKFLNGTSKTGAEFKVGVMGMNFGYFLKLTHEPRWNTLTWTLDYTKNSDFDDNVGHWQVMKHPTKAGWTRVLYSTKVKLFPWIPNIVVKFITTKALVESTTWVKKESEKEAAKQKGPEFKLPSWMKPKGGFMKGGATVTDTLEIDLNQQQLQQQQRPFPHLTGLFQLNLMRFKGFSL